MCVFGVPPRATIARVITESPGSTAIEIGERVALAPYELEPHLAALHEAGVLVLDDDDGWRVSPRVPVQIDDDFTSLHFETSDGGAMILQLKRGPW